MATSQPSRSVIYFPPQRPQLDRPSVVLYGAIEKEPDDNWASRLSDHLDSLPVAILNPRCKAWNSDWKEDISFAPFREQVAWEMDQAEIADILVFYFMPGTLTPIALLELGMHAARYGEKCVVCCPEGFYKRGNVQIVCKKFNAEFVEDLDTLAAVVKGRLESKLKERETV